jgi:hypothetical protein
MFASHPPRWTTSLRAAIERLKAFALLEETLCRATHVTAPADGAIHTAIPIAGPAPAPGPAGDTAGATRGDRTAEPPRPDHASKARRATRLRAPARDRRPGSLRPPSMPCTTPITRGVDHVVSERSQNARWAARRAAHR